MKENPFFEEKPFYLNDDKVSIKEDQVFVVLPFKNTLVFEKIIKPTLRELGLTCIKADDIFNTGSLMQDIAKSIRESAIILVDLTGKNANVFYELGIAHAFRKRVILLTQSDEDVPSDLKAFKYYKYDVNSTTGIYNFQECLKNLKESLDAAFIYVQTNKIFEIKGEKGNYEQIECNFLKQEEGAVSIWAFVDESHLKPTKTGRVHNYIMSHSTNKGITENIKILDENDKEVERDIHPNAWFIGRTANNEEVFWKFSCNDGGPGKIYFSSNKKLEIGWHLFSVIWSKEKDYVKFYIDNELAGEAEFKFWPKDVAQHIFIGTWPNKAKRQYFNSRIGKWIIFKNAISYEKLEKYFKESKPDK